MEGAKAQHIPTSNIYICPIDWDSWRNNRVIQSPFKYILFVEDIGIPGRNSQTIQRKQAMHTTYSSA